MIKIDHDIKKLYLSWDAIDASMANIAMDVIQGKPLENTILVPIIRGGLIPATLLSHVLSYKIKMDIPVIPIHAGKQGYDKLLELAAEGHRIILIDDILDTGETLRYLNTSGVVDTNIVIIKKEVEGVEVIYALNYEELIGSNDQQYWVVFPWETNPEPDRPLKENIDEVLKENNS